MSDNKDMKTWTDLIRNLLCASDELDDARRYVNRAECAKTNATDAVLKWLVPEGAKAGEVFCLAVGKYWLQARMEEKSEYYTHKDGHSGIQKRLKPVLEWRDGRAPSKEELGL